ncbi:hypothetical protein [Tenacibaculum amylolyticum]|uniref:hypothetical protein n=1 Tax=Tenacibaculum amylolyticum TaxID=104269 RepID=UPI0038937C35
MSNFLTTTFKFITKEKDSEFYISNVMTYGVDGWVTMNQNEPVQGMENQGIQYLNISSDKINLESNGVLHIQIDPKIVNQVPYASDKASLLISVNGSNLHIDIHSGGGMKSTGTYGNKSVSFDCDFGDVGEISTITCS